MTASKPVGVVWFLPLLILSATGCSSNGTPRDPVGGTIAFIESLYIAAEADESVVLTVTRTGGSQGAVTVDYTTVDQADGVEAAVGGLDFDTASGTLAWADGEVDERTITIVIHTDEDPEDTEGFRVDLSSPSGGARLGGTQSAQVRILDGEAPAVRLMPEHVIDGDESDYRVRVMAEVHGEVVGEVYVSVHTEDGTATAGDDYTAIDSGTLVLAFVSDGQQEWIDIPLVQDDLVEGDETFEVILSDPEGVRLGDPSRLTVTITDDDAPPGGIIEFSGAGCSAGFAVGTARVEVVRQHGSAGAVSVDCKSIAGGTAEQGNDYLPVDQTLSWADGEEGPRDCPVVIIDDVVVERGDSVILELSNVSGGAQLGGMRSEYLHIYDVFGIEPEPVLSPSDAGFDQDLVTDPAVLLTPAGTFEMFYVGATGDATTGIGRAHSVDGLTWTRDPGTPLPGLPPTARSPSVVHNAGGYHMWYHPTAEKDSLAYAASADGVDWSVASGEPVVFEQTSTWYATPQHVCVIHHDGVWKMWYSGQAGIYSPEIGYATSTDGIHWTEYDGNPVYSDGGLGTYEGSMQPTVILDGETYRMWMATRQNAGSVIYAASSDGFNWETDPADSKDVFGYFNIGGRIEEPSALRVGGGFYVYFADHNTSYNPETIGLAINPNP